LFSIGVFTNKKLIGATLVSMTLNGLAIYCPLFQRFLKTQPLTALELGLVVMFASIPLWVMELFLKCLKGVFLLFYYKKISGTTKKNP